MGITGKVRSGSRARRSRRELHERYVTVDRSCSRRTSSDALKLTDDSTRFGPHSQEEGSTALPNNLTGRSDSGRGCGSGDRENESESNPSSARLEDRLSACVSEPTEDVILGDAVFTNNVIVDVEQDDDRSSIGGAKSDLDDECHEPSRAEALCSLPNSVGTETYSMPTTVYRGRSEPLLKWQSILAVLLSCGTVRFTVEQYETLRGTLIWQSSELCGTHEALPGFRKIQRSLVPLMCEFSYAKSQVEQFRKQFDRTGQARVVLPSEWAIMDTSTGPLYEAMFCSDLNAKKGSGPYFMFDDIENSPIVVSRRRTISTSQCIFVDATMENNSAHVSRLPVVAEPGDSIDITFLSSDAADSIIGTGVRQAVDVNNRILSFKIRSVWHQRSDESSLFHAEESSRQKVFDRCPSLKGGDTIVDLQIESCSLNDMQGQYSYLLMYRFRRSVPGEPTKQLVLVPGDAIDDGELNLALCIVCAVRVVMYSSASTPVDVTKQYAPCSGYLHDGRRYVVYRVLLYCDDFQPYSTKSGSFGGCYMLPMGIPPSQRSGYGAVRYIGLTPPQVSSNEILQYIIPDIVKCSTTGVVGVDPWGNPVTIFIDVLGYIGDYPAVTHALDLLGHNSRAPCHLCSFLRQDRIGPSDLPYYGYTTSVHSKATSFCRSIDRMQILREENTANQELNTLGFQTTFDVIDNPLHGLSKALKAARYLVPLTNCGAPVVPCIFDPYRSSVVAPDHLLFGLSQDVLRATLSHCSPTARRICDLLITTTLSSNNLGKHRQVINASSASINSMGMSEMFAVLLVAPTCLESALAITRKDLDRYSSDTNCEIKTTERLPKKRRKSSVNPTPPCPYSSKNRRSSTARRSTNQPVRDVDMLDLLSMFQRLVNETHFWPDAAFDGAATIHAFNERKGEARMDILYGSAVDYVRRLHDICVRDKDVAGKHLNKPNVHRLLELYTHTIPSFGHCRHVQELLFETAHQPLKRAISRSNQRDPHISAVTATLANDWETRLSLEISSLGEPQSWKAEQCMRLHRLIAGRDAEGPPDIRRIRSIFCKPVLSQLAKVRRKLSSISRDCMIWKVEFQNAGIQTGFESWRVLDTETRKIFENAVDRIRASTHPNGFDPLSLCVAEYASSWNIQLVEEGGLSTMTELRRRFGCIFPGSVVQALVAEGAEVGFEGDEVFELHTPKNDASMHSTHFSVSFWLVVGLFDASPFSTDTSQTSGHSTRMSYAVVLPCLRDSMSEDVAVPVRVQSVSRLSIIALSQSVQNVMCIHACRYTNNCFVNDQDCVQHCGLVCTGTPFYVFGRREGYPPRAG